MQYIFWLLYLSITTFWYFAHLNIVLFPFSSQQHLHYKFSRTTTGPHPNSHKKKIYKNHPHLTLITITQHLEKRTFSPVGTQRGRFFQRVRRRGWKIQLGAPAWPQSVAGCRARSPHQPLFPERLSTAENREIRVAENPQRRCERVDRWCGRSDDVLCVWSRAENCDFRITFPTLSAENSLDFPQTGVSRFDVGIDAFV